MQNRCAEEKLIDKIDSEMQKRRIEFVFHFEIQHTIRSWRRQIEWQNVVSKRMRWNWF